MFSGCSANVQQCRSLLSLAPATLAPEPCQLQCAGRQQEEERSEYAHQRILLPLAGARAGKAAQERERWLVAGCPLSARADPARSAGFALGLRGCSAPLGLRVDGCAAFRDPELA